MLMKLAGLLAVSGVLGCAAQVTAVVDPAVAAPVLREQGPAGFSYSLPAMRVSSCFDDDARVPWAAEVDPQPDLEEEPGKAIGAALRQCYAALFEADPTARATPISEFYLLVGHDGRVRDVTSSARSGTRHSDFESCSLRSIRDALLPASARGRPYHYTYQTSFLWNPNSSPALVAQYTLAALVVPTRGLCHCITAIKTPVEMNVSFLLPRGEELVSAVDVRVEGSPGAGCIADWIAGQRFFTSRKALQFRYTLRLEP
jgi:hypothetical protein